MPVYSDVEFNAAQSVVYLTADWPEIAPDGWLLKLIAVRGQPVSFVREKLVSAALTAGAARDRGRMTLRAADVIVFQDSDVAVPDSHDYLRLVRTLIESDDDVGLVGAPCIQQQSEGALIVNVNMNGLAGGAEGMNTTRPFECAGIGFGLVAIRASVFQAIERPWFRFEMTSDGRMVGEDIGFTDKLRQVGYSVLCEPRVDAVHSFRRSLSLRDTDAKTLAALSGG